MTTQLIKAINTWTSGWSLLLLFNFFITIYISFCTPILVLWTDLL